jgi:hypothetical protein
MNLWSRHSNHGLRLRRHWIKVCRHIVYGLRRLLWRVQTRGEVLRLHHLKRMRMTTKIQGACQTHGVRCSLWCRRFASTTRCDVLCRKWHLLRTHRRLAGARKAAIKWHTKVTRLGIFKRRLEARGLAHVLGGLLHVLAHVLWWRLHRAGRLLCNAKARRKHTCARTHARQRRQPLGESTGDEPAMRRQITPRSDRGRRERRRRGPSARNAAVCVH